MSSFQSIAMYVLRCAIKILSVSFIESLDEIYIMTTWLTAAVVHVSILVWYN